MGKRIFAIISFIILLFIFGCKKDNTTSPNSNTIFGKWEVTESSEENLKYIIFEDNKYYYFLYEYTDGRHKMYSGVFSINDDQINFGEGILNYSLSNDGNTLFLNHPEFTVTCKKNNSVPEPNEWVKPLTKIQEIALNIGQERLGDIAYDGANIWIAYNDHTSESKIIKIDNSGNPIKEIQVNHEGGLTFGNGYLWIGDYDTISKIDPNTGQKILSFSLNGIPGFEPYLQSLAYEPGYIWVFSWNGEKIYRIDENTGQKVYEFAFEQIFGMTFAQSKLLVSNRNTIYSLDIATGKVIKTYSLGNDITAEGLAFDGTNIWVASGRNDIKKIIKYGFTD